MATHRLAGLSRSFDPMLQLTRQQRASTGFGANLPYTVGQSLAR